MDKDYSNRTIAYLLLVAIFVSVAGTLLSLSKMGGIGAPLITGAATSGAGTAQLTVASALSIVVEDTTVNFGECTPVGVPGTWFESNATDKGAGSPSPGFCTGLQNPDNLTIHNDGNQFANVTINASNVDITGGTLNKSLMFAMMNASKPGCVEAAQRSWYNMTALGEYTVCGNLTFKTNYNRIWVYFGVWVPSDATAGQRSSTLTFTAYEAQ